MSNIIRRFLRLEAASGIILMIAAFLAILLANSSLSDLYQGFLDIPVMMQFSALEISKPLLLWINDGLMAIFFLLIGLEVKRELLEGSLASRERAIFPVIAALGGMLAPALVYLAFNAADPVAIRGWAIPVATDIAFALGVMALLGKRVPTNLKVFLLALAIIDDLGVILVIALFYTQQLSLTALLTAATAIAGLAYLNWRNVGRIAPYLLLGGVLWISVLKSGVHATLAGVIIGLLIPLKASHNRKPAHHLEHYLHPWVAYLILPLFAFANAGVSLKGVSLEGLLSPLPVGIALGLWLGKPLGIFVFSWLAVKMGIARLPKGITFQPIFAVSVLCGIGFTMSIFIASLAFSDVEVVFDTYARLGILIGSIIAALSGYVLLRMALQKPEKEPVTRAD